MKRHEARHALLCAQQELLLGLLELETPAPATVELWRALNHAIEKIGAAKDLLTKG